MKKIFLLIVVVFYSMSYVQADVLKGKAVDEISTASPKDVISVTVSKDIVLNSDIFLKKGYVLTGKMLDITEPEKWHHNASFSFIPTSYVDLEGHEYTISKEIKGTYRQKMKADYKHSVISVGNLMFSPSYISNTKRMFEGETKEVWEEYSNRSTPWGKGMQIDIKPNETIYFNFPD